MKTGGRGGSKKGVSLLAVHPGALGDVVLFGRLLEEVGGAVTLAAGGEKARLLEGLGAVARAVDFESLPMHELFCDEPLERCRLPGLLGRHERLISCFPAGDRRAEMRLAAACGAADAAFLPVRPPANFAAHLLDLWRDLLGLAAPARGPAWKVPAAWRREARRALAEVGAASREPFILVHPGAGSAGKCWPLERFVELAEAEKRAAMVLGPVEEDLWGVAVIEPLARRMPVLRNPPLTVLAGAAAEASAFVGNDSGASHLAVAVGTPAVVLFGPTRAEHFAPLGPGVRLLAAGRMTDIAVGHVAAAVEEIKRQW